ncbi:MAG: hypothetical protein ACLFP0_06060 [Rhodosalinus sp.]
MRAKLRHLWKRHPFATAGFVIALAMIAFFTVRFVAFSIYWADPAHRQQPVAPWMTPRYIAHAWDIPPEDVMQALGVTARPDRRPTLKEIARQRGVPVEIVLEEARALIAAQGAAR